MGELPESPALGEVLGRPTRWCGLRLFVGTITLVPVALVAAWLGVAWNGTSSDQWTYAVVAVAVLTYAALATWWVSVARRAGAPRAQWLFGSVAVAMFVLLSVLITVATYALSHYTGALP
jgi:hypothetical protein